MHYWCWWRGNLLTSSRFPPRHHRWPSSCTWLHRAPPVSRKPCLLLVERIFCDRKYVMVASKKLIMSWSIASSMLNFAGLFPFTKSYGACSTEYEPSKLLIEYWVLTSTIVHVCSAGKNRSWWLSVGSSAQTNTCFTQQEWLISHRWWLDIAMVRPKCSMNLCQFPSAQQTAKKWTSYSNLRDVHCRSSPIIGIAAPSRPDDTTSTTTAWALRTVVDAAAELMIDRWL